MQHSLYLQEYLSIVKAELSHHPRTSAFLWVLPNTPVWGNGSRPSDVAWGPGVTEARDAVLDAVKSMSGVARRRIIGMYSSDSMWSKTRALTVDFIFMTSDSVEIGPARKPVSLFQLSPVWQREAIAHLLEANPRSSFRSYADALVLFDRGNPDYNIEYRQHNSGAPFWDAVISAICSGALGSADFACHIRDWAVYDPGVAFAVADIRARKSQKLPTFGYCGVSFQDFMHQSGGAHIVANAKEAVLAHLSFLVTNGTYHLPGCNPAPPVNPSPAGSFPLQPIGLKHCSPRDSELPIKQELYDYWGASAVKDLWETLVAEHDKELNKSGVPHKSRRPPETNIEALPGADASAVPDKEGVPASVDALKEAEL